MQRGAELDYEQATAEKGKQVKYHNILLNIIRSGYRWLTGESPGRRWRLLLPGLLLAGSSGVMQVQAATPVDLPDHTLHYVVVGNTQNNSYFIASDEPGVGFHGLSDFRQSPSFLGAKTLGVLGVKWLATSLSDFENFYLDMWIENSPVQKPLRGIACNRGSCPETTYLTEGGTIENDGVHHIKVHSNAAWFYYPDVCTYPLCVAGTLSEAFFSYLREQPPGATMSFQVNWCISSENRDYDFAGGVRCKDAPDNKAMWFRTTMHFTKDGQLTISAVNQEAEIWLASDGTPSLNDPGGLCRIMTRNTAENSHGIACKVMTYSYQGNPSAFARTTGYADFLGDRNNTPVWDGYEPSITYTSYGDGFEDLINGTDSINVNVTVGENIPVYGFISDRIFSSIVNSGISLNRHLDGLFSVVVGGAVTREVGTYRYLSPTKIKVLPREYSISIVSSDNAFNPERSGTIGDATPIEFEYRVTTSGSRQADSITAQVTGENVYISGIPYCLFTSDDETLKVPIPAYLSYTSASGATVRQRNSCAESPIDMTNASWTRTAWDASLNDGFFYKTNLKLLFPMDNSRSLFDTSGEEWMGAVSASGEVKVTATWLGVN